MTLLAEEWLEKQGKARSASPAAQETENSFSDYLNSEAGASHEHIVALARAIPDLPNEFEQAAARFTEVRPGYTGASAFVRLAVLVAFGLGAEWLFRRMTAEACRRLDGLPLKTVNDRLRLAAVRFAFANGAVAAFTLGSFGPFLTSTGTRSAARCIWAG